LEQVGCMRKKGVLREKERRTNLETRV